MSAGPIGPRLAAMAGSARSSHRPFAVDGEPAPGPGAAGVVAAAMRARSSTVAPVFGPGPAGAPVAPTSAPTPEPAPVPEPAPAPEPAPTPAPEPGPRTAPGAADADADDEPTYELPDESPSDGDGSGRDLRWLLMAAYIRIRILVQPYWRPRPRRAQGAGEPVPTPMEALSRAAAEDETIDPAKRASRAWRERVGDAVDSWGFSEGLTCKIVTHGPIREELEAGRFPPPDTIWCHSDDRVIEALGHFGRGSAWAYDFVRTDKRIKQAGHRARRAMKSIIAIEGERTEKSHLIPNGFHGAEANRALVVSWPASGNHDKDFRDFEERGKKLCRKGPILWFTRIERRTSGKGGATWTSTVMSPDNPAKVLDSAELEYRGPMSWSAT